MGINKETHNCRVKRTRKFPNWDMLAKSLLPRLRDLCGKQGRKIIRSRSAGWLQENCLPDTYKLTEAMATNSMESQQWEGDTHCQRENQCHWAYQPQNLSFKRRMHRLPMPCEMEMQSYLIQTILLKRILFRLLFSYSGSQTWSTGTGYSLSWQLNLVVSTWCRVGRVIQCNVGREMEACAKSSEKKR